MTKRSNSKSASDGGRKLIELPLDSGESVYVTPLSIHYIAALKRKAEQLYPLPEKQAYEKPIPEEKSVFPGEVVPAEQNPQYQEKVGEVNRERNFWWQDQFILLSVEPLNGRAALIEKYRPRLEALSTIFDLPTDEWEATVKFCLIATPQDRFNIIAAAQGGLVLSEEEVRDGVRIFRPILQPTGRSPMDGQTGASSAQPPESLQRVDVDGRA